MFLFACHITINPFSTNVFRHFCHLHKIDCNSADFVIETQTMYQMKDIVHAYLEFDLIFEITSEDAEKSILENSIF